MENINNIEQMLIGNIESIQKSLQTKMEDASKKLNFEEAVIYRNHLRELEIFTIEQSIISYDLENNEKKGMDTEDNTKPVWKDLDIVAGFYSKDRAGIIILHVRHGRLIGKTPYVINLGEKIVTKSNYLLSLFKQHYLRPEIPVHN